MNKLKEALSKNDVTIGTWLQIPSAVVTEIVAQNSEGKLDWMCIDMEHGAIGMETMVDMIRVIERYGITPIVRVPNNDYIWIHRSLDAGAKGIVVPMVKSGGEAYYAYKESKYPPEGERSFGYSRANNYGIDFWEAIKKANDEISVIIQIEHIDAIHDLPGILHIPIDGTFIGPLDLAGSMGKLHDMDSGEFYKVLDHYLRMSNVTGIPTGTHVIHPNNMNIQKAIENGYKIIAVGLDTIFLEERCRAIFGKI